MAENEGTKNTSYTAYLTQLEDLLDLYLVQKAPFTIPTQWKEFIVKFLPWVSIIMFIATLPIVLAVFGFSAFLMPLSFMGGVGAGFGYMLAIVFLAISLVLEAMAIPGLFKNAKSAWKLLFYSVLLNAVYNLFIFNLGGLIIGGLISLYCLFQIKSYYK